MAEPEFDAFRYVVVKRLADDAITPVTNGFLFKESAINQAQRFEAQEAKSKFAVVDIHTGGFVWPE